MIKIILILLIKESLSACTCETYLNNDSTEGICTKCSAGCVLEIGDESNGIPQTSCVQITLDNCQYESGSICSRCNAGLYFDVGERKCLQCTVANCEHCSDDGQSCLKCTTNSDGHQLVVKDGQCVDCFVANSALDEFCGRCGESQYFNTETKKCVNCPNHCLRCLDANTCLACASSFYLRDGACGNIMNCRGHTKSVCYKCNDGEVLVEGQCQRCPDYCQHCTATKKATPGEYDFKCTRCSVNTDGSERFLYNGKCYSQSVMESTYHCLEGDGSQGCFKCVDGYYLQSGECLPCSTTCKYCRESTDRCLECAVGYHYEKLDGTSFKCIVNDANCEVYDRVGCIKCKQDTSYENRQNPGYYLNEATGTCLQCNAGCSVCNGSADNCSYCVEGYLLTNSGSGYTTCRAKATVDAQCKTDVKGFCVECNPGYALDADLRCISTTSA